MTVQGPDLARETRKMANEQLAVLAVAATLAAYFVYRRRPSPRPATASTEITAEELAQHTTEDSLWMAISGTVVDVTAFAAQHPGGAKILSSNAGTDATAAFNGVPHSPDAAASLAQYAVGTLADAGDAAAKALAGCLNLADVERLAKAPGSGLSAGARAYYDAGAEDGETLAENLRVWGDWLLRPRVLVDVSAVDVGATVLGTRLELPLLAAPTALLKMSHPEGEGTVAAACAAMHVGNCLSTTASMSIEDVRDAAPECYRWFQLYVYRDRERTRRLIERAEAAGYSAICLTVDLPVLGNRTSLRRIGFRVPSEFKMANVAKEKETAADKAQSDKSGVSLKDPGDRRAYALAMYDQNLSEELIPWIASVTSLPIVVKGVLRGDSAVQATRHPQVRAVVVSNHGGRQLDGAISPLTALPDVANELRKVNEKRAAEGVPPVEIIVDGGVRRGRDIFKALALGAKAVLVGRPLIYGLAAGGEEGVKRVIELLEEELVTCMQLCGCQTVEQIDRSFVVHKSAPPPHQ